MPLTLTRSWTDEDLDRWRDTCVRFVEHELQPGDEAARQRGNVGHALWRKAGELGPVTRGRGRLPTGRPVSPAAPNAER